MTSVIKNKIEKLSGVISVHVPTEQKGKDCQM